MKSKHTILAALLLMVLVNGCSSKKNLIGKWKVISVNMEKNKILTPAQFIVFDAEGFITFNNGSAARGEWEMNTSKSILTLFLYGKALQHDLQIKGEYHFSSDKLTVAQEGDELKILLELQKVEQLEPTK
jgi:hypothetical protein